jgi:DNA-binding NarL/FixJ family response regulator
MMVDHQEGHRAPNDQIAGHLHPSVRTVESHLQRVYEELGIAGRRELADALREQPDP